MIRPPALPVLAAALFAAGCSSVEASAPEPVATPPSVVVDWAGDIEPFTTPEGWTVAACEGDAPILCVTDGDRLVGGVELLTYPELERPGDLDAWYAVEVREHERIIREDREATCGDGYTIRAEPPVAVTVDGEPGVRFGLIGSDGVVRERSRITLVHRGPERLVIAMNAYHPEGCIGTEGGDFTPADLATFIPIYDAIVAGSILPDPSPNGG